MKNKKDKLNFSSIVERFKGKTPPFWVKVRNVMLTIGAVSGAILAAPVALPATLVVVAGYGLTIGAVGASLASITVDTP